MFKECLFTDLFKKALAVMTGLFSFWRLELIRTQSRVRLMFKICLSADLYTKTKA